MPTPHQWFLRHPLVAAACGLLIGLTGWPAALATAVVAVPIGVITRERQPALAHALLLLAIAALVGGVRQQWAGAPPAAPWLPGTSCTLDGRVERSYHPPPRTDDRAWFLFATTTAPRLRLRVNLPEGVMPPVPGTTVRVHGYFAPPDTPRNPWEWDEARAFRDKRLAGILRVPRGQPVQSLVPPPWWHPLATAHTIRAHLATRLAVVIPDPDNCAIVLGIALGLDDGLGDGPMQAFRRTGSYHLFSVSGMHVAMFVGILWLVLEPLALPRRRLVAIIIPLVYVYALITGWEAPVVRAAMMTTLLLGGLALDRVPRLGNSLAAAGIILLLADPTQRHDLGFQFTFTVVAALVCLGLPLANKLSFLGSPDPFLPREMVGPGQIRWWTLVRWTVGSLCIGLAAAIGSLPLSLAHFNLITPVGIPLGLALAPLSWMILAAALATALADLLGLASICVLLGKVATLCASACLHLCSWAASLPGAWHYPLHPPAAPAEAIVFDLDRGGASMLLRSATHATFIDCGNPGHVKRTTARAATQLGHCPPDLLVITHGDAQHRGGHNEFAALVGPPRQVCEHPIAGWAATTGNIALTAIFPPPGHVAARADDRASVLRATIENWRLIWLGDAGFATQRKLLDAATPGSLGADVLCVGWHHTDIGLLRDFVDAVQPRLVIWHRWRAETMHPPDDTLREHLRVRGIPLMEQSLTGAVTLSFSAVRLTATPFLPGTQPLNLDRSGAGASGGSVCPAPATGTRNP